MTEEWLKQVQEMLHCELVERAKPTIHFVSAIMPQIKMTVEHFCLLDINTV